MEAGSDTTTSALLTFLLAISTRPEVLQKVQAEVDQAVGTSRLPQPDDIPNLEYTRAVMLEVFRWRPTAAGGIPHVVLEDDQYGPYFFPKGTMFLPNTWAIHRSREYIDPEEFNPDRWLKNEFGITDEAFEQPQDALRRQSYGFGAGRRICQAQSVAQNSQVRHCSQCVLVYC